MKQGRNAQSFLRALVACLAVVMLVAVSAQTNVARADNAKAYAEYDVTVDNNASPVSFNGISWYVIKDDSTTSGADGTITLLAAENRFDSCQFNKSTDDGDYYSTSHIKSVVDKIVNAEYGQLANVKDAIADTDLSDVGVTGAKVYLLSSAEARAVPQNIRRFGGRWWLRSPGDSTNRASFVYGPNEPMGHSEGDIGALELVTANDRVRPALRLKLSSVIFLPSSLEFLPGAVQPTGKKDLSYDGTAQELLVAGSAPAGWSIHYKVDSDEAWQSTVPTRTEAGTYVVQWQFTKDAVSSMIYKETVKIRDYNPLTYDSQEKRVPYNASAQTIKLEAAQNGQGNVSYAIQSQSPGDYFSLNGLNLQVAAGTPIGTYTVVVRATAAGNADYLPGSKDSTVTLTVVDSFPIWIDGSQMTVEHPYGNGWSYDRSSNTLTLDGISLSQGCGMKEDASIYADSDLIIELNNSNNVGVAKPNYYDHERSIRVTGNLTITGEGTLNAKGNLYGIYAEGNITINSGTVNAEACIHWDGAGIHSNKGSVFINGGKVTATGYNRITSEGKFGSGIYAGNNITISRGEVTASGYQGVRLGSGSISTSAGLRVAAGDDQSNAVEVNDFAANHDQKWVHIWHDHSFTYAVGTGENANTLTATCTEGCTNEYDEYPVTLTISAEDAVYNGSAYTGATLDTTAWTAAGLNTPTTIMYSGREGTTYGSSETAPTNAGDYTASVTFEDKTATADFTISRADIDLSVTLAGWTYGEEANAPSVEAETIPGDGEVTYTYAEKGSTEYSETVPTEAGDYTVKATVAETDNYNAGEATADFAIAKADIEPSVTLEGWTYGEEANAPSVDGNLGNGEVTYTYKAKDAADSTYAATAPTEAGDYTVKATVAETTNYNAGEATAEFTIAKADIEPSVTLEGWTYGEEANAPSVDGNPGEGEVTYTYAEKDGTEYSETVPAEAGDYTVKATVAETDNYKGGEAEADFTIAKADAVPAAISANHRIYDGTENPLVTVTGEAEGGEMQYALGTATEVTGEYGAAIPTATDAGTYYVWYRVVGDDNHESTDELGPVEVNLDPEHAFGTPDFVLPEQLKVLDESAFEGVPSLKVVDAHNCTSIGKDAFKGTGLKQIRLPKDCEIDPEAFGEQRICVFAPAGGTTEAFCTDYDNLVFIAEAE